jgi:hypothetical protein
MIFSHSFPNLQMASCQMFSKLVLFLFLLCSSVTFAQAPGFEDDVNDETTPTAAIDSNRILYCALGVVLGFYLLRKNNLIKFQSNNEK